MVRIGYAVLYVLSSRDDPELRRSVVAVVPTTALSTPALLLVASTLDGVAQGGVWALAVGLDALIPAMRGIGGWRLVPSHFAERHNLVIILALGESIVALGIGAEVGLTAGVIAAATLGIGLASALWWVYFDLVSFATQWRLEYAEPGVERNRLARDSYTYLHFPMVAGIVLVAFGLEESLAHVDEHLHTVPAFALLGGSRCTCSPRGVAAAERRHGQCPPSGGRGCDARAFWPLALEISALAILAVVNAVLWIMIAVETRSHGDLRYRARHGEEVEIPLRATRDAGGGQVEPGLDRPGSG